MKGFGEHSPAGSSEDAWMISFPGASLADANRFAASLAEAMRDSSHELTVDRVRTSAETQDFGATLVAILGTAAITAVAKGIAAWIARNSGAHIEFRRNGKTELIADRLDSQDVSRIVKALSSAS